MENANRYYNWFERFISVITDIFFYTIPLASLYVFTSFLSGTVRMVFFGMLIIVYLLVIRFGKELIKKYLEIILAYFSGISERNMLIIIAVIMIITKVIVTLLFSYDATAGADIKIYNDIADEIVSTGDIRTSAISHLFGIALHFAVFKFLHIPLHIGTFIAFFIGTIVNFCSFKEIIGKEKTFFLTVAYLLMPSTAMISFCLTHELFVYFYLSLFMFFLNRMLREEKNGKILGYTVAMILSTVMTCFVNPVGYIIYVISGLLMLFSNIKYLKKALLVVVLIMSVVGSNAISSYLNVNEFKTTVNTYTILIHGSNIESLGEQVDGYPKQKMREYLEENDISMKNEHFLEGYRAVLINQYIYLLKHPVDLVRLVSHKIYILWSGVHYPLELANHYGAFSDIVMDAFLAISTIIYLFIVTVGIVFSDNKKSSIYAVNYKLVILGIFAVTMLSVLLNKYTLYATMFLYFISLQKASLNYESRS
ncbi:MAG: hypothetical protein IJH00_00335 [Erysipelotrichaceae bacterium]|nr:hypothetical protein [Erysipelotrichaceae bacterium]MBQ6494211.1 hypothetical protein [Erysipelotrichaceae bacterium]